MEATAMEMLREICADRRLEVPRIKIIESDEFDFYSKEGVLYIDRNISEYKFNSLLDVLNRF